MNLKAKRTRVIIIGLIAVFFLAFVMAKMNAVMRHKIALKKQTVNVLKRTEVALAKLRQQPEAKTVNQDLAVVMQKSLKDAEFINKNPSMQIQADGTVIVTLKEVPFTKLSTWLKSLTHQYAIKIIKASFDRADSPGVVNASLQIAKK